MKLFIATLLVFGFAMIGSGAQAADQPKGADGQTGNTWPQDPKNCPTCNPPTMTEARRCAITANGIGPNDSKSCMDYDNVNQGAAPTKKPGSSGPVNE